MQTVFDSETDIMEWYSLRQRHFDDLSGRFASEIMEKLKITDREEFEDSLQRAFQNLHVLGISVDGNFRKVFRFNGEYLVADWKVSPLATYLIIINCDPSHALVARAQLFFVMTQKNYGGKK